MTQTLLRICNILLAVSMLASCSGDNKNTTDNTEKKTHKKGRMWDKVNIVNIPLTAEEYPLKGKVKTVTYREYELTEKNGKTEKKLVSRGHNEYDAEGHLVDQNDFDGNDKPQYKCTYAYDDKGHRKEWHFIFHYRNDESTTTFKYDDKGNIVESVETNKDPKKSMKTACKYDDGGNVLEETMYDANGKAISITQSKYDEKGNQVEYISKDGDGKQLHRMTAVYDEHGYKTSGGDYDRNDTLQARWTRKNDAAGQILEMTYLTPEGKPLGGMGLKYDDKGNTIEYYQSKDGTTSVLKEKTSYEYDKVGNPVKETSYEMKNGKPVATSYTETEYTYY